MSSGERSRSLPANIPTSLNQPFKRYSDDGSIKPPAIEWEKNDPKTTKHLPTPDSSWMQSVSYDSNTMRMTITTKDGASWQHGQVSPGQFTEMELKPSKGSYYAKNIKGQHPMTPIKKNPTPRDYPGRKAHEPKDLFKNPLHEQFTRYKSKGRYA